MQDRESRSDVNPGRVEQRLDEASTEGEMRGGPVTEREREDGGQITQREAFSGPGNAGRDAELNGSRSGGSENAGDRSDPMPRTSASGREDPAPGGGLG